MSAKRRPGLYRYEDDRWRLTIQSRRELDLEGMVAALIRDTMDYEDDVPPVSMSAADVTKAVRAAYDTYGDNAVWTWSDHTGEENTERWRAWARGIILGHWPELGENT